MQITDCSIIIVRMMRLKLNLPDDVGSVTDDQIRFAYELAGKKIKRSLKYGLIFLLEMLVFLALAITAKSLHVAWVIKIILILSLAGIVGFVWGITSKYLRFKLFVSELRQLIRTNGSSGSPINPAPAEP
ncbi:MAG: hypothetical protein ACXWMH_12745 [Syntrophales bacterium]